MGRVVAYEFGLFRLDLALRRLFYKDEHVPLFPKTIEVLMLLLQNRGRIVKREDFVRHIWHGQFVEENNLTVRISALRKILEAAGGARFIETVSGRGYRFVGNVHEVY